MMTLRGSWCGHGLGGSWRVCGGTSGRSTDRRRAEFPGRCPGVAGEQSTSAPTPVTGQECRRGRGRPSGRGERDRATRLGVAAQVEVDDLDVARGRAQHAGRPGRRRTSPRPPCRLRVGRQRSRGAGVPELGDWRRLGRPRSAVRAGAHVGAEVRGADLHLADAMPRSVGLGGAPTARSGVALAASAARRPRRLLPACLGGGGRLPASLPPSGRAGSGRGRRRRPRTAAAATSRLAAVRRRRAARSTTAAVVVPRVRRACRSASTPSRRAATWSGIGSVCRASARRRRMRSSSAGAGALVELGSSDIAVLGHRVASSSRVGVACGAWQAQRAAGGPRGWSPVGTGRSAGRFPRRPGQRSGPGHRAARPAGRGRGSSATSPCPRRSRASRRPRWTG